VIPTEIQACVNKVCMCVTHAVCLVQFNFVLRVWVGRECSTGTMSIRLST
jgi:hypothetical protein